ncbi:MAG: BatD family protein [Bacteroidales bacterium]|jgi:uncharacterized membrane protein|nr:BatD family protein [Bacteroidales bacterium]
MKKLFILLTGLFFIQFSYSQNADISISSPAKVGIGQRFTVQYSINQQGSDPQLKNISNFSVLNGPNVSTSTNVQMINGSVTQSVTYSYSYTLSANAIGTFNLPTISINAGGKTYTSKNKTIEVQKDAVQNNNSRQSVDPFEELDRMFGGGGSATQQNVQPKDVSNEDIFVRVFLSKTEAYKGEPIIVTIKIFTAVDLAAFDDVKMPAFDSFYAQEIESPQQLQFTRETVNNKLYNTAVLKKYILYPRVFGKVTIEKCKIDCQVRQVVGRGWSSRYEYVKKSISSAESEITVKNLPEKHPANYDGAVGNFLLKIEKSADTITVNEPLTIKITLSGTGNFNMVNLPKINFPDEFEIYDPEIINNTSVGINGLTGSKIWEYTIIPRYPGNFKFGKMNFSFFNLSSLTYQTQNIDDLKIFVKKGLNDNNDYSFSPQHDVKFIGNETIKFIKNNSLNLSQNYYPLIFTNYFPLFLIFPLIIFVVFVILLRKKIKENSDISKVKAKKANKISKKRLKKANQFIKENKKSEFYKEIISALWGYASDKLNIPTAELTKQKIISELQNKNIDENIINNFINVIDKCEYAHFAPDYQENELSFIFSEASNIIEELEQKIK